MHLVLCLEEILLNIFGHCHDSSLGRLARTCRTFKEPALDVLWNCLRDLTPLVRCLPRSSIWLQSGGVYLFKRRLKEAEWRIILGYTRRVRGLRLTEGSGLALECVKELSKPPPFVASIFPRLSSLQLFQSMETIAPFIRHLANPEVRHLLLTSTRNSRDVIDAFGEGCPNVNEFLFITRTSHYSMNVYIDAISKALCRWTKLTYVHCADISLTVEALSYLSRRNLDSLSFCPDRVANCMRSTPSGSLPLRFSPPPELGLSSRSLTSVGRFFDYVPFPGLEVLCLTINSRPTMPAFMSFFMALRGACGHDSLQIFNLKFTLEVVGWPGDDEGEGENWDEDEGHSEDEDEADGEIEDDEEDDEEDQSSDASSVRDSAPFSITYDCISPLTAFGNIRCIIFNTPFPMDLNEQQLLLLASSWPRLEDFEVGNSCESSVITPGGFLQLLERCRLLQRLSVTFDIRGYKEIPQGHPWRGLAMPEGASISLLHSAIEEESIEALGVFFHMAPFPDFCLNTHWNDHCSPLPQVVCDLYFVRWAKVFSLARDIWEERRKLRHSLETRISQQDTVMDVAMIIP